MQQPPMARRQAVTREHHGDRFEDALDGKIKKGVLEGKYTARIVLADDDPVQRRTAAQTIHPKFLKFESSGLGLEVPAKEPVQLQVLRR